MLDTALIIAARAFGSQLDESDRISLGNIWESECQNDSQERQSTREDPDGLTAP